MQKTFAFKNCGWQFLLSVVQFLKQKVNKNKCLNISTHLDVSNAKRERLFKYQKHGNFSTLQYSYQLYHHEYFKYLYRIEFSRKRCILNISLVFKEHFWSFSDLEWNRLFLLFPVNIRSLRLFNRSKMNLFYNTKWDQRLFDRSLVSTAERSNAFPKWLKISLRDKLGIKFIS